MIKLLLIILFSALSLIGRAETKILATITSISYSIDDAPQRCDNYLVGIQDEGNDLSLIVYDKHQKVVFKRTYKNVHLQAFPNEYKIVDKYAFSKGECFYFFLEYKKRQGGWSLYVPNIK